MMMVLRMMMMRRRRRMLADPRHFNSLHPSYIPAGSHQVALPDMTMLTCCYAPSCCIVPHPLCSVVPPHGDDQRSLTLALTLPFATVDFISVAPWEQFGGNIDNKLLSAGSTLYLPVNVKGASWQPRPPWAPY